MERQRDHRAEGQWRRQEHDGVVGAVLGDERESERRGSGARQLDAEEQGRQNRLLCGRELRVRRDLDRRPVAPGVGGAVRSLLVGVPLHRLVDHLHHGAAAHEDDHHARDGNYDVHDGGNLVALPRPVDRCEADQKYAADGHYGVGDEASHRVCQCSRHF